MFCSYRYTCFVRHKIVLGSEVDFGKAIAATVNASVDGDVEKC